MTTPDSKRPRALPIFTVLLGMTFMLALASTAGAQIVTDPRIAEFDPSPDHDAVLDSGEPAVLRYELGVYMAGAAAPFTKVDMGKPSPESDGKIRYDFSSNIVGWPLPGGTYEARVGAVGPEGEALSEPSNPFAFGVASPCSVTLASSSISVPANGGSYTVEASTGDGCAWYVSSALSWVTPWTSQGSGTGTVSFDVKPNTSAASRSGSISIGSKPLAIEQAGLATPVLSWAKPAAIVQGTPLGAAQLNATAAVPGTFAYSPAAGTVLAVGTQTLRTTFTPADATRYTTATASTTITVDAVTYSLTVTRPAGGTVNGAGINCGTGGTTCSVTMSASMTLGLQATPASGYAFSAWTGSCTGTSPSYTLVLNGPKTCGATFTAAPTAPPPPTTTTPTPTPVTPPPTTGLPIGAPYTLTIERRSGGVVKSAGINCGTTAKACSTTMPAAMTLGLQATADPGYAFLEWTGHCSGTSANYAMALEGPRTCAASFIPAGSTVIAPPPPTEPTTPAPGTSTATGPPYSLTITRPTGGTVNSAGINCGTRGKTCSVTIPAPIWLGMLATPDKGYTFGGWSGDCSGTQVGYSLALAGPRACSATFRAIGN